MPRPAVRALARSLGQNYYWGSSCSRGHQCQRRVSNGSCVECEAENQARRNASKICRHCKKVFQGRWRCKTCSDECKALLRSRVRVASIKRKLDTSEGRFEINARQRLIKVIKRQGGRKSASFVALVGISPSQLIAHIESLFQAGMSWDNYGQWHLDHIRPCSSFDLTDPEQQSRCFNWTNLQPLWAADNLRKSSSWLEGK
jgi:hypothetical protein